MDGNQLNVGIYRDATLIATNDLGIFSEIMEAAAFRGANEEQSYLLQMSLCASGVSSAPVGISDTVCGAGSLTVRRDRHLSARRLLTHCEVAVERHT